MTTHHGGAPLVLIHGFPLDDSIWDAQADHLMRRSIHFHAPDLSGFTGDSLDDYARKILADADAPTFIPVGHSMGGYIAFALHRLAPDRIAGAVLVSTRAGADGEEPKRMREINALKVLKEGTGFLAESMSTKLLAPNADAKLPGLLAAQIRERDPKAVAAALRAMAKRPDSTEPLSKMNVPVLIVHGRLDQIIPPAEAEAMAKACPHAKVAWCETSGHMPMMEQPERVSRLLEGFAQQVTSA